jgi:UDP-N-acetylglucosamine 2-epimerase (non-hydrolysing)
MQKGQDLYDVTAKILLGMRRVLELDKPDIVLVHGDTVTSMAASLSAFYQRIMIGHVEAGLRTYNIYSPWPEEMNRQLTSRLATFHFAPTFLARENLLSEKIHDSSICVTGNTVIDALNLATERIESCDLTKNELIKQIKGKGYDPDRLEQKRLILITGHRRENFGDGFTEICRAIKMLAGNYPGVDFVYPVHLNPNVQKPVREMLLASVHNNVFLIPPLDYLPFVFLMKESFLILSDSGGIQEEAPSLGKPVLVMRDTTERPEALEAGTVRLVGANCAKIMANVSELLEDDNAYQHMAKASNPYGDGRASERIVGLLTEVFSLNASILR